MKVGCEKQYTVCVYLLLKVISGRRVATWKILVASLVERMAVKQCIVVISVARGLPLSEGITVLAGACFILLESISLHPQGWAWLAASEIQMGKLSFKELVTCVGLPTRVEWRQTWAAVQRRDCCRS